MLMSEDFDFDGALPDAHDNALAPSSLAIKAETKKNAAMPVTPIKTIGSKSLPIKFLP